MAAYTAVISLLQTLEQFQQRHPELVQGQTAKTLKSIYDTAEYFQNFVEEARKSRSDLGKIKTLEEKIRVAANDTEDVVEKKICEIISGTCGNVPESSLQKNFLPVVERINTIKNEVMDILSDFSKSTHDRKIFESVGDSFTDTSSGSNLMLHHLEDDITHGLEEDLEIIVQRLTERLLDLDIVTISGMGGIGKTTLARKTHDHLKIRYHFDIRVWITITQEYASRNVLLEALHCISKQKKIDIEQDYDEMDDSELADLVQKELKGPRYLVVVDDIWSTDVWDSIVIIFPDCNNRSRILLTTRETNIAMYANPISHHEMNLLNLENKIGKKIALKCQGLPLTISVVAGHLSKVARTLGSWMSVARTLGEIIASHPDKCLGVLGLSYHHLPNHLKPCFLSMGGFPEDYQVETWRLIQLWIAEGFIRRSGSDKSLEEIAEDYLGDLISRNLIMVRKRRFNGEIKACGVHDLLREFCLTEAEVTKVMHVEISDIVPTLSTQKYNNGRRFSFQIHGYLDDNCFKLLPSTTRSIYLYSKILYFVELEVFSRFNLLRVLAISHKCLSYGSIPLVITKLFHLRYLQIRSYANLPASIAELQNLQTLIYERRNDHTTLPEKIWKMRNLRRIHMTQPFYLPNPSRKSILNLEELSHLCFTSCTNEILSSIPNLKKLTVRHTEGRINHLIDMSSLTKLESLKCVGHALLSWTPPISIKRSFFPTSLKRLTLAGRFCFPWEDMSTLVMLKKLEELKLKNHAANGHVWRLSDKDKFKSLELLLFNDLTIKHWEASSDNFPNLKRLLYQCGIGAEDSARKIEQEQEDIGNNCLKVYIHI
ncbi:unnamed protein product [Withania somnifera]